MNIKKTINDIRVRISDNDEIEYTDSELVGYINDALFAIWLQLKAVKNKEVVRRIDVTANNQAKPNDFFYFTARYPIVCIGDRFETYGQLPINDVTYYSKSPKVSVTDVDVSVFGDNYDSAIVQVACLYALNRNEFNIQQDHSLANEVRGLIGT